MSRLAILVLFALASLSPAAAPPISHLEWAKNRQGRYAYGMYMSGGKVGWILEEMKLGKREGKPVLYSTSETYMLTLFEGVKSEKIEKSTTCYELVGDGAIVFAESIRRDDGKEVIRRIDRVGEKLRITTKQGGRTILRSVAIPRDTLAMQRQLEGWLASPRQKGDRFTKYSSSWEEEDVNTKHIYRFKSSKPFLYQGARTTILSVDIDLDGGTLVADVLPNSHVITGVMGGLITMKLEKESVAKKMSDKLVDLLPTTSILIDRDLGDARHVDSVKLELTGLGEFQVPASHRQVITPGKDSATVQLLRDFRVAKAAPLTAKEKKEYTSTTPRFQCDHEQVKNLAKKLVGDEKDPLKAARKIEKWVYDTLKKSYEDNADTALEILDKPAGDCTEHSLIFVSLCRAAGIPAREVGGLAYTPGDKPMFGWHAWAEVHDGHQWVSVDPTWHQIYVDGTHLKMSSGDRDLAWTNVIGTIKMKVLDVKTRR